MNIVDLFFLTRSAREYFSPNVIPSKAGGMDDCTSILHGVL